MADYFIDRSTAALWEAHIIKWRRIGSTLHSLLMDNAINLIGGDSRTKRTGSNVKDLAAKKTGSTGLGYLILAVNWRNVVGTNVSLAQWHTSICIVGSGDLTRNRTLGGVREGTEGSSELEFGPRLID
jgi:hypothetical protein